MLFFLIGSTETHRFACNFPTAFFLSLWHFNFPVYLGFWFPVKSSRNGIVMAPENSSELSITLHIVNECTRNAPIRYICFHKIRVCGLWIDLGKYSITEEKLFHSFGHSTARIRSKYLAGMCACVPIESTGGASGLSWSSVPSGTEMRTYSAFDIAA